MNTLRLTLNPLEKKSHINPEYTEISRSTSGAAYMTVYMSAKTATFPTQRASAQTSSTHSDR